MNFIWYFSNKLLIYIFVGPQKSFKKVLSCAFSEIINSAHWPQSAPRKILLNWGY